MSEIENSSNLVWHKATVTRERREDQNGHRGGLSWLTGLSAAGESTLAHRVEKYLYQNGFRTVVLEGDNLRYGLCADPGFSVE